MSRQIKENLDFGSILNSVIIIRLQQGSWHGMLPVRPRCTHPPVGNPCSCGRCGEHAVPPQSRSLAITEFRMLSWILYAVPIKVKWNHA
jgi:hypothetical protein